ncbi:molybdate ABC transporter substrate-binding protein [Hydrogenophaga sp.]|uniref:molybdate ABC transporter substrate-binding protein n=1 Tax=Hydrogenophaga sp. TaxID=1904254 RepID=UPI0019B29C2B|nr:molybdate ABC transporter substrate-binding protein [Hydrogenophaga sp.]MBD3893246.1 molybdate ABC transporter substrate-binding protein [Hydrogenophaga sp.]
MRLLIQSLQKCLVCLTLLLAAALPIQALAQPTVAAAASLRFALEEIRVNFERETGHQIRLVFGSSGHLFSQINQGAPFQMFLSADEHFVFKLADTGKTQDRGLLYAVGRIGIMVPHGSALKADAQLQDLRAALQDGRVQKFAIANPAHAPYGMRAREALQHAGLWEAIGPRLVLGENVAQAAQFATSGAAQGGIIGQSLATLPALAQLGHFVLIPEHWHQPLRQRMVLMQGASAPVQAFYLYMSSPAAQAIMERNGFNVPRP